MTQPQPHRHSPEPPAPEAPPTPPRPAPPSGGGDAGPPRPLPWYTDALMVAHLVVTRDVAQHEVWQSRLDRIRLYDALERVPERKVRAMMRRPGVFRRIRRVGFSGALFNGMVSLLWLSMLIPAYAVGHGFGWLAALTFLLPLPLAWAVGRRLFEDGSIANLAVGEQEATGPTASWVHAGLRSFIGGFGFGFTLLFLQGLISWFMTPAPTIGLELMLDGLFATYAGFIFGSLSMAITPLVASVRHVAERTERASPGTWRASGTRPAAAGAEDEVHEVAEEEKAWAG